MIITSRARHGKCKNTPFTGNFKADAAKFASFFRPRRCKVHILVFAEQKNRCIIRLSRKNGSNNPLCLRPKLKTEVLKMLWWVFLILVGGYEIMKVLLKDK
ncbi:MAG: hypothetical protein IKI64_02060 [Clostridia bacterium]|nr:hypothetical protein [Clostridia bacterium]